MFLKQIYYSGLNHASYFVGADTEAVVIDPIRDIADYLALAEEQKMTIKYIFLTQIQTQLITGHLSLAKATGAKIVVSPKIKVLFKGVLEARQNDEFEVGNLTFKVVETPGHSIEQLSFLLKDEKAGQEILFTGRALSKEGLGMPHPLVENVGPEVMLDHLYDTVHEIFGIMDEDILIYPGHIVNEELENQFFSLKEIKEELTVFQLEDKAEWIRTTKTSIPEALNHEGVVLKANTRYYEDLSSLLEDVKPLDINEFKQFWEDDKVQIIDLRDTEVFTLSFIPKSLSLALRGGKFEYWASVLLEPQRKVILLADDFSQVEEAVKRLANVGIERADTYLLEAVEEWVKAKEEIDMIIDVEADEFAMDLKFDETMIALDVRSKEEHELEFINDDLHIPLEYLADPLHMSAIQDKTHYYVYSGNGYRSVTACSLLKKEGFFDVRNVLGGYESIKEQDGVILMVLKSDEEDNIEN